MHIIIKERDHARFREKKKTKRLRRTINLLACLSAIDASPILPKLAHCQRFDNFSYSYSL